ncbi:class I SAM-dependent methyltransferase [candidate division WOR-3 bacterium]|nr:class I SAM-dependent methyltransferase [candidate division WOR-3 bacterium]
MNAIASPSARNDNVLCRIASSPDKKYGEPITMMGKGMSNDNMKGYYSDKLSAERLKRCYEIAPPRVQQYLKEEVNYVLQKIHPGDTVLELGCGYGRILPQLTQRAHRVIGIDTSLVSLYIGRETLCDISNCFLVNMNAIRLAFNDRAFDLVVCIQNGISALHVAQKDLIRESIRVTKVGGTILFSSYSDKFWKDRLEWFELQSKAGLLGVIDNEKTRDGVIVCKDGFTATTVSPDQFLSLTTGFNVNVQVVEVDESSIFYEVTPL